MCRMCTNHGKCTYSRNTDPYTFVVTRGWVLKKHLSFNKNNIPAACSLLHFYSSANQRHCLSKQTYESLCSTSLLSYHILHLLPDYSLALLPISHPAFLIGVLHLLSQVYFHSLRRQPLLGLPARYTKTVRLRFEGRRVFHWRSR